MPASPRTDSAVARSSLDPCDAHLLTERSSGRRYQSGRKVLDCPLTSRPIELALNNESLSKIRRPGDENPAERGWATERRPIRTVKAQHRMHRWALTYVGEQLLDLPRLAVDSTDQLGPIPPAHEQPDL